MLDQKVENSMENSWINYQSLVTKDEKSMEEQEIIIMTHYDILTYLKHQVPNVSKENQEIWIASPRCQELRKHREELHALEVGELPL